jgi:hypothetical protein
VRVRSERIIESLGTWLYVIKLVSIVGQYRWVVTMVGNVNNVGCMIHILFIQLLIMVCNLNHVSHASNVM